MKNQELSSINLHFVAGKGGVGKSTISYALARSFAQSAHKTLLVELSELDSPKAYQSVGSFEPKAKNLDFLKLYPDQALYEYLHLKMNRNIVEKLLSHNFVRMLCSIMPGLSDLTRLGKLWFLADQEKGSKTEHYDKIVVDMPSSGFVSRFLSIARVVKEVVKIGPLAKDAQLIDDFIKNPQKSVLHLVSLPEETVLSETFELYQELLEKKEVALGLFFINKVLSLSSEGEFVGHDIVTQFFSARKNFEINQLSRLKAFNIAMPQIFLKECFGENKKEQLARQIAEKIK